MELIGTCEFLEDSVREAEQQAQTVPYEQALTMLNTLPFIQNVQETAQPEANQSAVKVHIQNKPVWLMLDMLYLDQVFSQNINGKGDVIIADSGGINDRKEDLQSFIVCSAPLFDDGLTEKMSALLIFKSLNTNADFSAVIEQTRRLLDQQSNECDMISFNLKNISCTLLTFEDETVYKQAVEEIRAHFKGAYHLTDSSATTQIKDLHKFLAGYLSDLNLANEQSTGDGHVVKVIKDYIADNYQQNITLSDLAEITYLHTTYISKLFKKETGENISDYILNFRMKKAKKLLLNPKYKIYEVAEMTGFNDAKYFGNVFKSMVGMTPKEYRKGDE